MRDAVGLIRDFEEPKMLASKVVRAVLRKRELDLLRLEADLLNYPLKHETVEKWQSLVTEIKLLNELVKVFENKEVKGL